MTKPADVDEAEFAPDAAPTVQCDAVPELIEEMATAAVGQTPRPEHTGSHRMAPEEFARVLDQADRDAYERGDAAGYARGLSDGKAEVRAADWEDGVDAALRGLKVFLVANKFAVDYAESFSEAVRPFIKRGG